MLPLGTKEAGAEGGFPISLRTIWELAQYLLLRVLSVLMLRKEKGEVHG